MNFITTAKRKSCQMYGSENAEKCINHPSVGGTIKWDSHWGKWLGNYIY